ncbi:hypothetical protein FPSE_05430 [Fusarium pseudograminearum CS3096]|uniref:Uncharacterized protein n=1 Tax=Fusarium pseudograminearum (strain CS3096) TaxID=1028729 RepID=K3VJ32_FUSPC|nr:hypothetical protein FPSE_05430 [Fusarium pseudograminearum CS3096]EKJ74359.1 hypothetical protein FPSE_05430 [Fusarium pseudograminearum CS3096]KAF0639723.1 hypothetical protein FPSE5266_05430 [Fusarium pseudograminearum]
MSQIDTQISTAAVIGWQSLENQNFLADPDPQQSTLTFKTRFEKPFFIFEIWIPVYIKIIERRILKNTFLILSIQLSTIETFSLQVLSTIPEPVERKLNSPVLRLDFRLSDNITTLIPLYAREQPKQGRTHSGVVLDSVLEISQATSISVYINHSASYEAQLNSIRNSLNEGYYQSIPKTQPDLQRLYQGQGAKIAHLHTQPKEASATEPDQLPSYHDTQLPSSGRLIQLKKRPRVEDDEYKDNMISSLIEAVKAMQEKVSFLEIQQNT